MSCLGATSVALEECGTASPVHVGVVSDYQAFLELKPAWDSLAKAADLDYPFLEHDWIRCWWECCGKDTTLHVLVICSGAETIAIAPLVFSRIRMWGIPVRRLGFFYNDHVPRADFLISQRHADVYRAIWQHLLATSGWDLLQLCQVPEGSGTLTQFRNLAAENKCPNGVWASGASPFVTLSNSWTQYQDDLAAKHRSNLRNRFKRLNQLGPTEMETISTDEPEAIKEGFQLEAAAWKADAGTAISNDPDLIRFYTTLGGHAASNGWLRLHFLRTGAKRIAFDYSLEYKNRLFLLKLGYDPEYAPYSPSNLLLSLALQDSFEQGMTVYDFLGQTAEWKKSWTKDAVEHYWMFIFRPSVKGRLLHTIKFRLIPWLKGRTGRNKQ